MTEGQGKFSRREFLKMAAVTGAGAVLAGCAPGSVEASSGKKDFMGPYSTDEGEITLDFSGLEGRAREMTIRNAGEIIQAPARIANSHPVIIYKDKTAGILDPGSVDNPDDIGRIQSLKIKKLVFSKKVHKLNDNGELTNVGFYPTPTGPTITDEGRDQRDVKGNTTIYWGLEVLTSNYPVTGETRSDHPLTKSYLVLEINSRELLGYVTDHTIFDEVK
ncbi:MAG: twin-arginine translocation signal domain-containing protein [Candidatus Microgenomates bacterium]|jgi:hypothetical protein